MDRISKTYTFFIVYIIINIASSAAVFAIPALSAADPMLYNIIGQLAMFIPTLFVGVKMFGEGPKETFLLNRPAVFDIIEAVILVIALMPVISFLSMIMLMFFPNNTAEALTVAYDSPLALSIISICVIPAVFEELVFRGIIFSGLKNVSLKKACIMGGLLFAIAHFDPQQALYTFLIGSLFCYVAYRTRSIFPSMVSHFTINFSQLMMSRIALAATGTAETDITTEQAIGQLFGSYFILSLASVPIIIYILSLMGRKNGRGKPLLKPLLSDRNPQNYSFTIENESVLDYNPQKIYEEGLIKWQLIVIIVLYILIIFFN